MSEFLSDIRIQQSILILLISLMAALFLFGLLLKKFRFFDKHTNLPYSVSQVIGNILLFVSSIMGLVSVLVFIFSLFGD